MTTAPLFALVVMICVPVPDADVPIEAYPGAGPPVLCRRVAPEFWRGLSADDCLAALRSLPSVRGVGVRPECVLFDPKAERE